MSKIEHDLELELDHLKDYNRSHIQYGLSIFKHYDKDHDRKINRDEFKELCKEMNIVDPQVEYPDYDEDGFLNVIEFLGFFLSVTRSEDI